MLKLVYIPFRSEFFFSPVGGHLLRDSSEMSPGSSSSTPPGNWGFASRWQSLKCQELLL